MSMSTLLTHYTSPHSTHSTFIKHQHLLSYIDLLGRCRVIKNISMLLHIDLSCKEKDGSQTQDVV